MIEYPAQNIPSPLREVLEFEGVYDKKIIWEASQKDPDSLDSLRTIRWGIFGLPGMGKSTICKKVYFHLREHSPMIFFPEAADYAVKVQGLPLIDFEPFLNSVYAQMEFLARELIQRIPGLLILKEPAYLQNEIYLLVQKSYANINQYRKALDALAEEVNISRWNLEIIASLHRFVNYDELFNLEPSGPWITSYAVITTTNPLEDLDISLTRQKNPERDPRLMTSNLALLCGYLEAIRYLVEKLEQNGRRVELLNPNDTIETLSLNIERAILESKSSPFFDNNTK